MAVANSTDSSGFVRTNQVVGKVRYLPDPVTIYKAGEEPRKIHRIDISGWIANGWSEEELDDKPEKEPAREPEPQQPKRIYKARKAE